MRKRHRGKGKDYEAVDSVTMNFGGYLNDTVVNKPLTGKETIPILDEREKTHGDWKHQSVCSQGLKKLLRECGFNFNTSMSSSQRESLEMICVKLSRIVNGNPNEIDHWKDIAGYAQLVVRELEKK
jgi:hypothetical protein